MKKTNLFILSWALMALLISSCNTKDEVPRGEFATGVIIVNEGNYSESNGSIGFYNESNGEASQDIFNQVNGVSPGGIIQSIYFYENLAFIIDQAGNRIDVVEAETFKSVATIESGLNIPRYMVVANGKGYVSNWGDFDANYDLPDSYVAVIDLATYAVINSIPVGNGAEGLLVFGGNVYVANSFASTIEMINTTSNAVTTFTGLATGPTSFIEDKNGKVWLLSSSFFTGSALSQLDLATEEILKSFPIAAAAKSLNINGAGDQLYYLSTPYGDDAEVRSLSIEATEDPVEALISAPNLYGLGIDPTSGLIYLGNHNGFQGNGTVLRYQGATLKDDFPAGIAPNGFVFRK